MPERIEDYEVIGIIGSGSFGTCYKVRKKNTSHVFVWKAVDYGSMSEERKQLLITEVNVLRELRHPNIVRYFDRIIHKESATIYIIMEWCSGGDLASMISRCIRSNFYFEEVFVWRVLYQTSRALHFCHSPGRQVLHCDIKPANLFLDSEFNVKLGDFGLARVFKNLEDDKNKRNNPSAPKVVGTPFYMSPEVVKGIKYNKKSDIWSLGCVIYELCSLVPPFSSSNMKSLALKIEDGRFARIPSHYSNELQQIIIFMLTVNHERRPTIETIVHHPSVVTQIAKWTITKNPYRSIHEKENHVQMKEPEVFLNETFCSCVDECCVESSLSNIPSNMFKENGIFNKAEDEAKQTNIEQCIHSHRPKEMHCSVRLKDNLQHEIEKEQESISSRNFKEISSRTEKMNLLRQREAKLRLKELNLEERERHVRRKEREAALASRLARETMGRACVYLNTCRDGRASGSTKVIVEPKNPNRYALLDDNSSLDQEQGDTSVLAATSTKLDPRHVNKPAWHGSMTVPRNVTFSLKYDEVKLKSSLDDCKNNTALLPLINGGKMNKQRTVVTLNNHSLLESITQMHRGNIISSEKENIPERSCVKGGSSKKRFFGKLGKELS